MLCEPPRKLALFSISATQCDAWTQILTCLDFAALDNRSAHFLSCSFGVGAVSECYEAKALHREQTAFSTVLGRYPTIRPAASLITVIIQERCKSSDS